MIHKIDHVKVYTRNKKNLYPEFFLTYIKIKVLFSLIFEMKNGVATQKGKVIIKWSQFRVGGKLRLNLLNWKYQMVFERKYSAIFVNIKMVLKVQRYAYWESIFLEPITETQRLGVNYKRINMEENKHQTRTWVFWHWKNNEITGLGNSNEELGCWRSQC